MSVAATDAAAVNAATATPEQKHANFTLAVTVILHAWPALTAAVQAGWGCVSEEEAADKRDWLCGAVADLFVSSSGPASASASTAARPGGGGSSSSAAATAVEREDVEDVLLQVMADEFEVALEDGSEIALAARIVRAWEECERGEFAAVREMYAAWTKRGKAAGTAMPKIVSGRDTQNDDDDEDDDDESGSDEDVSDEEMRDVGDDADHSAASRMGSRRRPEPEIDDEGFTKVVGRRKGR